VIIDVLMKLQSKNKIDRKIERNQNVTKLQHFYLVYTTTQKFGVSKMLLGKKIYKYTVKVKTLIYYYITINNNNFFYF